mmetsp:Transcript_3027/g.8447  ORF Transcript_3027/g.8447 Transcript_3027/m.8447 type:complete len:235 (+) Transcript_3027:209-913(+)
MPRDLVSSQRLDRVVQRCSRRQHTPATARVPRHSAIDASLGPTGPPLLGPQPPHGPPLPTRPLWPHPPPPWRRICLSRPCCPCLCCPALPPSLCSRPCHLAWPRPWVAARTRCAPRPLAQLCKWLRVPPLPHTSPQRDSDRTCRSRRPCRPRLQLPPPWRRLERSVLHADAPQARVAAPAPPPRHRRLRHGLRLRPSSRPHVSTQPHSPSVTCRPQRRPLPVPRLALRPRRCPR